MLRQFSTSAARGVLYETVEVETVPAWSTLLGPAVEYRSRNHEYLGLTVENCSEAELIEPL